MYNANSKSAKNGVVPCNYIRRIFFTNLYKSLKKLVKQTKLVQKEIFATKESPIFGKSKSFLKEYGTVKICAARRSGHTFTLSKFALKEANSNWYKLHKESVK